jgi:hypothetical protein
MRAELAVALGTCMFAFEGNEELGQRFLCTIRGVSEPYHDSAARLESIYQWWYLALLKRLRAAVQAGIERG